MATARGGEGGRRRALPLISRLGSGGMADVWLADDTTLDRKVALKFLHERFASDTQFVERFKREAQSAAGLQHPNVVGVYDRGEWEGTHYIAMEYVAGAALKDLIERGVTVGEAVEITRQILAGASFAHERGIVHRDLKPGNVLVDARGPRPGHGLRDRPRRRLGDHPDRVGSRHRPLPLARAGPGPGGQRALGPLLGRRDPLRGPDRPGPVRRRQRRDDRAQAGLRAAAAAVPAQPRRHPGARLRGAEGAGQGSGQPLRHGGGVHPRPRRRRGRPKRDRRHGRLRGRRRSRSGRGPGRGRRGHDGSRSGGGGDGRRAGGGQGRAGRRLDDPQAGADHRRDRAAPGRRRGLRAHPARAGAGSRR